MIRLIPEDSPVLSPEYQEDCFQRALRILRKLEREGADPHKIVATLAAAVAILHLTSVDEDNLELALECFKGMAHGIYDCLEFDPDEPEPIKQAAH